MSSQEKIVIYDSVPAKVIANICTLTIPIWGFLAPAVVTLLTIFLFLTLFYFNLVWAIIYSSAIFYLLVVFVAGKTMTGVMQDNRLIITEEGLKVTALASLTNRCERQINWNVVTKVLLIGNDLKNTTSLKLRIFTGKSGRIDLGLSGLTAADMEYLLVSLSNWVPARYLDERLDDLKEVLWNNSADGTLLSYTKMWEDELASRYSATAYLPLNPGQKLQDNKLKVVRQLAFGGWSAIYLVQQLNTRLCVLKESVVPPRSNQALIEKAQEMFLREATFLIKLDHPKIVKVHEHFIEDDRHYLLLDYITGQNIRQKVKLEGPFHQLDVLDYCLQLTDIFCYLHSQNPVVLHRDVTPDNIVLTLEGKLMLIDFGAANELIGTATGTLVGKQCYISPEQFRGHATISSDLYGLGATIFYMLTGRDPEPLTQSAPSQVLQRVSIELDQLVQDLTAQNESDRPKTAFAVRERTLAIQKSSYELSANTA